MVNSREKGKRGERECAAELNRLFGLECRRGQQFSGIEGKDVVGWPGVHVECKRDERLNVINALKQAIRDARHELPVVIHRKNNSDWMITLRLEDLKELARRVLEVGNEP